jgi:septal ring factor EnvC (AmiA/AmiB activator)
VRLLFVYFFIFLFLIPAAFSVDEVDQKSQELQKLKHSRDKMKQEKTSIIAKEKSVIKDLGEIERQLAASKRELRIYELNLKKCENEINQLRETLEKLETHSKETQSLMNKRLKAMYKFSYENGQLSYLRLLIESDGISDLMSRYKYMSAVADSDRKLLEKIVAEKTEINSKKEEVEARKKRILYYKAGAERIRQEILRKKEAREDTLAKLRKSEKHLTERLTELEKSVQELETLIAQLRSSLVDGFDLEIENLEDQYGNMQWPVTGNIINNSAPSMSGITIQADEGTDIRCVASGIVEYSDWFDGVGFGQMVIVDHGKGYRTLYAHASELLVVKGQRVKKGQTIAKVGDTGSVRGSMLYFQIWKGTKPMPTRQWLR